MGFEWETETEITWEEMEPRQPKRRRWGFLGLLLLLLLPALFFTRKQLEKHVAGAMTNLEQDVRSSHELAQHAERQRDEELFLPLLSGRDTTWVQIQRRLFAEKQLFYGAAHPFDLRSLPERSTIASIVFSPDLREAVLTARHVYEGVLRGAITLPEEIEQYFFIMRGIGPKRELLRLPYVHHPAVSSFNATLSPDGRWLAMTLAPPEDTNVHFILHDLQHNETVLDADNSFNRSPGVFDCSEDAHYLARLGSHFVELLAPAQGTTEATFRHFISTGQLQCTSLAWIKS